MTKNCVACEHAIYPNKYLAPDCELTYDGMPINPVTGLRMRPSSAPCGYQRQYEECGEDGKHWKPRSFGRKFDDFLRRTF